MGLVVTLLAVGILGGSLLLGLRRGDPPSALPTVADRLASPESPRERVRVEVLNASGITDAASKATRRLRDHGFDVVYYGNARGFSPDTSLVLDRVGRPELAQRAATALAIGRVVSLPDTALYLEVTVVIGRDWRAALQE